MSNMSNMSNSGSEIGDGNQIGSGPDREGKSLRAFYEAVDSDSSEVLFRLRFRFRFGNGVMGKAEASRMEALSPSSVCSVTRRSAGLARRTEGDG
jgi:hypothetical protein